MHFCRDVPVNRDGFIERAFCLFTLCGHNVFLPHAPMVSWELRTRRRICSRPQYAIHRRIFDQGLNCTIVLTIASRSSVTVMNQVFASAGGLGAVIALPMIVAGTDFQLRFERRPVSVV